MKMKMKMITIAKVTTVDHVIQLNDNSDSVFADLEGVGFFPIVATMNHSCDPNCLVTFEGSHVAVVRARRAISKVGYLYHTKVAYISRVRKCCILTSNLTILTSCVGRSSKRTVFYAIVPSAQRKCNKELDTKSSSGKPKGFNLPMVFIGTHLVLHIVAV